MQKTFDLFFFVLFNYLIILLSMEGDDLLKFYLLCDIIYTLKCVHHGEIQRKAEKKVIIV